MTKEEFFSLIENLTKELEEIKEKLNAEYDKGNISESEEYDRLRSRQWEIMEVVDWYNKLNNPNTPYKDLLRAYTDYVEYSKKYNLEPLTFSNDKVAVLQKHYRNDELVSLECAYNHYEIWDFVSGCESVSSMYEDDLNSVLNYFENKKEKDIYKWELEYVTFLIFYDKLSASSYSTRIVGEYEKLEKSKECEEYVHSFDKIIKDLDNDTFSFNLLLWTVFKTYHYLYNKNSELVFDKSDLVLIDRLLTLSLMIVTRDSEKRTIKENSKLSGNDKMFVFYLSQLLCLDMIHTIYGGFPDYYDTCIMLLGYGLYIPGGCSDLSTSMRTFDKFIDGITNYDFWLQCDGPKMFNKLNIEYDYEKVLKDNQN